MYNKLITLGIETSCDETGVSIYNNENGILSEFVYSQTIHHSYGGTVPDLASKDHLEKLLNLIIFTLKKAKISINNLNCISYSQGPGLKNSLLVGTTFCKTLSFALSIPVIGINHLEAHIFTSFLFNKIKFPCLAILISGAHTMILRLENYKNIVFLFETLDDSVGEIFDKVARALNLFPCNGSSIEIISNRKKKFKNLKLPKAFYNSNVFNFSFSGLKTEILNIIYKTKKNFNFDKSNIAYNFQNTVIKSLLKKCKKLLILNKFESILLAGGAASNKELRLDFKNFFFSLNIKICFSPIKYCTDNGTMIAFLGFIKLIENSLDKNLSIKVFPRIYF